MSILRFASWNVNGIRALSAKKDWDWFRAGPADVVAVQETKAEPSQVPAGVRDHARAHGAALPGAADVTDALVPNLRQTEALRLAVAELDAVRADVGDAVPWDVCAVRLDSVAALLGDVTGLSTPDEVLNRIFASFCVGK
jgi:tRNA modification GTPase